MVKKIRKRIKREAGSKLTVKQTHSFAPPRRPFISEVEFLTTASFLEKHAQGYKFPKTCGPEYFHAPAKMFPAGSK